MDPLSDGYLSQLMVKSFPEINQDVEIFMKLPIAVNLLLAVEEWVELGSMIHFIRHSKFVNDEDVMKQFTSKIIVPAKHWISLQKGRTTNSERIIGVIEIVSWFGSKDTVVNLFTEHDGIKILGQFFQDKNCTNEELKFCLRSLLALLEKTDCDHEFAKLMVPVATRFKDLTESNKVDFEVCMLGVQLMERMCLYEGPKDLASKVFKFEVSSYALRVFTLCEKYVQEESIQDLDLLCIYNSVCKTLQFVLQKKSAGFNERHTPIVSKALLRIMKLSAVDLHKDTTERLSAMYAATVVMAILVKNDDQVYGHSQPTNLQVGELYKMKDFGIVKEVANAINAVLQLGELNESSHGPVCNGYVIIENMISIEPSVRPIAPILTTIYKSFCDDKSPYSSSSHAGNVASFCLQAVVRGSKEDVKYLVMNGLIPLLAKLWDYLSRKGSLIILVGILYELIIKVPETDELFHFKEGLYGALCVHLSHSIISENGKGNKEEKNTRAFVIAAIGISCMCIDETLLKSLEEYFSQLFQEIQSGEIPKQYPGAFLVKKMAKVNSFKSCVLPHLWHLAEHGSDELVKDIFDSLPDLEEPIKVKSQDGKKDQVLKHVLVEVKAVFDRKSDYQTPALIKLTKFLTTIPCSEQDDVVLYHLEDLVSPCLGLLEDQNNKEIIRLVKKFINNLHYS